MNGIPGSLRELRTTIAADRDRNHAGDARLHVTIFRVGQYATAGTTLPHRVLRVVWRVVDLVYLRTIVGCELPPTVRCGPGLALPHAGRGLVVHPDAVLGAHCMVFHRVTVAAHRGGAPVLGDHVVLGAGSGVLGAVRVGRYAHVGMNAVVTSDVEPFAVVVGVPAVVQRVRSEDRRGVEALEAASASASTAVGR